MLVTFEDLAVRKMPDGNFEVYCPDCNATVGLSVYIHGKRYWRCDCVQECEWFPIVTGSYAEPVKFEDVVKCGTPAQILVCITTYDENGEQTVDSNGDPTWERRWHCVDCFCEAAHLAGYDSSSIDENDIWAFNNQPSDGCNPKLEIIESLIPGPQPTPAEALAHGVYMSQLKTYVFRPTGEDEGLVVQLTGDEAQAIQNRISRYEPAFFLYEMQTGNTADIFRMLEEEQQ